MLWRLHVVDGAVHAKDTRHRVTYRLRVDGGADVVGTDVAESLSSRRVPPA